MYLVLDKSPIFRNGDNMTQNNPLRQFFRRPAIYLTLPSKGIGYSPDVITMTETGELPVYPMTAIDDITAKTPDALFNGQAVVDIIKSCVPAIKNPWAISSVDLNAILIAIRTASNGNTLDITTTCPACKNTADYGINLVNILATLKAPDYGTELAIMDLHIKFKPLTYKEMNAVSLMQFNIQRDLVLLESIQNEDEKSIKGTEMMKNITATSMKTIANTIEHIRTPNDIVTETAFIAEFLEQCDKHTYEAIKEHNAKLREAGDIKPMRIICDECGHDYEQAVSLNVSDFFG